MASASTADKNYSPTHTESEASKADDDATERGVASSSEPQITLEIVKLKQTLGLHNAVALIVGCIIGSGIFVSPKGVLQEIGSVGGSLIIWALCGVISLVGALCYSELGTSVLRSGGDYAYIREALGGFPGFLYLWVAIVVIMPTGNAVGALTFAYYILQPIFPTCEPPESAIRLIAALAIILLTFVNCSSVNWANRVQYVFTVAKVLALVIIILIGCVQLGRGEFLNFENGFEGTKVNPGSIALAFYSGLFSYAGWNSLNFVTEELKNPYVNLPRAIWISMPLITIIYVFANVAYFTVLSAPQLLQSNAVAVSNNPYLRTYLTGMATSLSAKASACDDVESYVLDRMLGVMAWCMPLFVAASTFGSLNGGIFTSARLAFVGAREGHFPMAVALINYKRFTPIPALILGCIISVTMLVSKDVYVLINYTSFVESVFMALSVIGLFVLRWTRPNMHRPIKVNLVLPVFFLLIMSFLVLFPLFYNATECLFGVAIIATGLPVYLLLVAWRNKPLSYRRLVARLTVMTQKLFLSVGQESDGDDSTEVKYE